VQSFSFPSSSTAWRICPQGDRCVMVYFGDQIDMSVGRLCLAAAALVREASLPGVIDVVPSFIALAIHYQPRGKIRPRFETLATQIDTIFKQHLDPQAPAAPSQASREVEIPVCYGGEYGPDLQDVARHASLTPDEIVGLHTQPGGLVFMLGFAPGAPYIGVHDERLNIPRRASPRTAVPAGSVAVANRQSVLYPSRSPGGWNIIGATPLSLFDPHSTPATLLQPGDRVRFVPIQEAEYRRLLEARR
jgi:KipI family sensor histidine kinase inhibitor